VPGAPLLFLGLLFGAWAEDFSYIGVWTLLLLAIMAAITYVVEFAASILGVKKYGGSKRSMIGAALGEFAGLFLGIPGILVGTFCGGSGWKNPASSHRHHRITEKFEVGTIGQAILDKKNQTKLFDHIAEQI